ncbi:hypothetical protein AQUCO_01900168v1 [Aquilegia coerulea]|uniref:Uncharacterized protein n=1 Tax=Aquilegia coerulea TaxID=218851 RepID=A0A2G5DJE6_AQUCA|nr:hypothetical protein AQUCO_01900168v1 [Aquilegia coerulea]PIA43582.1 hypothetical protein AQUCO_01900168v1 [Aquilegia coerulea]
MEFEISSKKMLDLDLDLEEDNNNDDVVVVNHQKGSCFLETSNELSKVINGARVSLLHPTAQSPEKNNKEEEEEQVAVVLDVNSPLTCDSSEDEVLDNFDLSPRTPKDYVFNPFAPGPDDLMLAPQGKRFAKKSLFKVVRRLNFDSSAVSIDDTKKEIFNDDDDDENNVEVEEVLLDKMYKSFLDVIVSMQTQGDVEKEKEKEGVIHENFSGFTTPTHLPLLNGIAETCPGAPIKSRQCCKKMDLGFCKKLDFHAD